MLQIPNHGSCMLCLNFVCFTYGFLYSFFLSSSSNKNSYIFLLTISLSSNSFSTPLLHFFRAVQFVCMSYVTLYVLD